MFASQVLSGIGGGRDNNAVLRKRTPQLSNQTTDGKHFTDGDRVNPNHVTRSTAINQKSARNLPHPLSKAAAILAVTHDLVEPVRQACQHTQRQHEAVQEITQVESF